MTEKYKFSEHPFYTQVEHRIILKKHIYGIYKDCVTLLDQMELEICIGKDVNPVVY